MSAKISRKHSGINPLLAGLLATGLSVPALLAQSVPFPTYQVGANQNGSQGPNYPSTLPNPWVVSSGQIITPAGTQVYLGTTTRAKAVALNPNTSTHTAAVLQMGAPQAVTIFNTQTGAVLQTYKPFGNEKRQLHRHRLHAGWLAPAVQPGQQLRCHRQRRSCDGLAHRLRSRQRSDGRQPLRRSDQRHLLPATALPGRPAAMKSPAARPSRLCRMERTTSYPLGIAISPDGKTAYVVLDNNDTLTKIDLTLATPVEGTEIRVGNVPHSVVISPDGKTAYVSNEAGRIATAKNDFQGYSNGTPVVAAYPTGSTAAGTDFRGRPVHVYGHRQHLDRPAPDRDGLLGQEPAGRQCL